MINLILAAISVASLSADTPGDCFNPTDDFESYNVPTSINQINGWFGFGGTIEVSNSVPNGNQFLALPEQFSMVFRDLSGLPIDNEFRLEFDIAVDRTTSFLLNCGGGGQPVSAAAELLFDFGAQPPVLRYVSGAGITAPLPIPVGALTTVALDVNIHGSVTVNYGGSQLALDQWPLECRIPNSAQWISMGTPGSANRIDNLCVRDAASNTCDGGTNSTGVAAKLFGTGSRSLGSNDFTLVASDLPANRLGTIIVGTAAQQTTMPGPMNPGGVCIAGVGGVYPTILNSGPAGTFSQTVNWGSVPQVSGATMATAGDTWHFQAYYRDSLPSGALIARFSDRASVVVLP